MKRPEEAGEAAMSGLDFTMWPAGPKTLDASCLLRDGIP